MTTVLDELSQGKNFHGSEEPGEVLHQQTKQNPERNANQGICDKLSQAPAPS